MLCSHDDPHEGNTVGRVLRSEGFIGYTWAGRLDLDAEGLLLVTNDGDLVHVLSHPRYEVPKTYNVWLDQTPKRSVLDDMLKKMEQGIIDQGDRLHILSGRVTGRPTTILLRLVEGKKREIKRLFGHFDLTVVRLQRTAIGPIQLDGLRPGQLDLLSQEQVRALQDSVLQQSSSQ
jgi:pseudouridine synthase